MTKGLPNKRKEKKKSEGFQVGNKTGIAWTDHTWNPWQGCHKVSPGCENCYMFRDKRRYGQDPENVHRSSVAIFNAPLKWSKNADAALLPHGERVFTCSWSDFFVKEADGKWRDDAWQIIRQTPNLIYQILTKRPQRIEKCLPADSDPDSDWGKQGYQNVWLGVTCENQTDADRRIPLLIQIPAAKRFLSCEPLLGPGPLDLTRYLSTGLIHQVIVGGESGPNFRDMNPEWALSLRDQCQAAGVAFFFKQWSGLKPTTSGHLLDGVEYKEFPQ